MNKITKENFDFMVKNKGLEQFTQQEFSNFIESNKGLVEKATTNQLGEDGAKAFEEFKEEINSFTVYDVLSKGENGGPLKHEIMYVREEQVKWDPQEFEKSEDGEKIEKARGGVYKDTVHNRKLGRVGQRFGGIKKESGDEGDGVGKKNEASGKLDKIVDSLVGDYKKGKTISAIKANLINNGASKEMADKIGKLVELKAKESVGEPKVGEFISVPYLGSKIEGTYTGEKNSQGDYKIKRKSGGIIAVSEEQYIKQKGNKEGLGNPKGEQTFKFKGTTTDLDEIDASFARAGLTSKPDFNSMSIKVSGDQAKIDKVVNSYKNKLKQSGNGDVLSKVKNMNFHNAPQAKININLPDGKTMSANILPDDKTKRIKKELTDKDLVKKYFKLSDGEVRYSNPK